MQFGSSSSKLHDIGVFLDRYGIAMSYLSGITERSLYVYAKLRAIFNKTGTKDAGIGNFGSEAIG